MVARIMMVTGTTHAARPAVLRSAILLVAMALAAATPAPLAQDVRESSFTAAAGEVARKVAEAFPKLEGLVIRVDGEILYLDLGEGQRAAPGMELSVFRPGQEFRNPYTGKVLGVLDREIATARVVEVRDKFSVARVIGHRGDQTVKEQDRVRMTGARLSVVLPVLDSSQVRTVNARALTREIQTALGKTGRFEVIDDRRLRSSGFPAKPAELTAADTLKELGAKLHAAALLVGRVVPADQALRIEMDVLSTATARPVTLASADIRSRDPRLAVALGQRGPGGAPVATTDFVVRDAGAAVMANLLRGPEFESEMRALAVGNVFGDGRRTLVTTDGRRVLALAFDGTRYQRVWEGRVPPPGNAFAVDVADVNGDGRAEIFVTSYGAGRLSSFVLEFDGKEMRHVWDDVPLFFRSVSLPNGTVRVFAQHAALGGAFQGPAHPILWQDGRYVEGPALELPSGVNLYRFALAEGLGPEGSAILAYDPKSFLEVVDGAGKVRFRSKEPFGGAEMALEVRPGPGLPGGFFTNPRVHLGARIYPREARGQFLVPKNLLTSNWFLSGFGIYDRSKLYGLRWDGSSLHTAWETKEVDGFIADYAAAPAGEEGLWEATLLLTRPALWGEGTSRLLTLLFKDPAASEPRAAVAR